MELSEKLSGLLSGNIFELKSEDFKELKHYFITENKSFIKLVDTIFNDYKKREDVDKFLYFLMLMHPEVKDISPFVSFNINKVFVMMIKNNYYKQIAEFCDILEACANIKVLDLLNAFTKSQKMGKFLTNVEIYKLKKLVFDLSKKYKKDDIAYQIEVELEKVDNEWIESVEK